MHLRQNALWVYQEVSVGFIDLLSFTLEDRTYVLSKVLITAILREKSSLPLMAAMSGLSEDYFPTLRHSLHQAKALHHRTRKTEGQT